MNQQPNYRFYPSLLDKFNEYLNIDAAINAFWNAEKSPAEVEQEIEQGLINSINRVPFESEAAEKGTAFNELVDRGIAGSIEITATSVIKGVEVMNFTHTSRSGQVYDFNFSVAIVKEFVEYFKGAASQVFCQGVVETKYGRVELYGYLDELKADVVYDIKTTSKYDFGKYSKGWQKHVYPFCLTQMGCELTGFEYTVTNFKDTYREWYDFNYERSRQLLKEHCERFIEFIESRRDQITDNKIFNKV